MSACGPKLTWVSALHMSAIGGKAEVEQTCHLRPVMPQSRRLLLRGSHFLAIRRWRLIHGVKMDDEKPACRPLLLAGMDGSSTLIHLTV
jgi:hypothetical protein